MESKEKAIIFDVDGTLAHMNGRIARHGKRAAPYADWDAHDDDLDEKVAEMVETLSKKYKIIICSGRKDSSQLVTENWLNDNKVHYDEIFMRRHDDNRKDSIVKRELYEKFIQDKYNIHLVFDDRNQVVKMWREELGLTVFQVADGDF